MASNDQMGTGGRWQLLLNRWAWVPVLVCGVALFVLLKFTWRTTHSVNLLPCLVLVGSAIVPAAVVTFVYARDTRATTNALATLVLSLLGGVTAIAAATLLEYGTAEQMHQVPVLAVAVIEESSKLAVAALAILFLKVRDRIDGLVAGTAVGAGFAVIETLGYAMAAAVRSNGNLATIDDVLFERGVFSPATHMAWTGLAALALVNAAARRWRLIPTLGFAATFAFAVGMHWLWDTVTGLGGYAGLAAISIAAVTLTVVLANTADREDEGASTYPAIRQRLGRRDEDSVALAHFTQCFAEAEVRSHRG